MAAARIGRVRLKADRNVIAIRGAEVRSDRKAHFVNHVGACFDAYVSDYGQQPDAIVLVLGGVKQNARCSWTVQGESEGAATSMLALATGVMTREVTR